MVSDKQSVFEYLARMLDEQGDACISVREDVFRMLFSVVADDICCSMPDDAVSLLNNVCEAYEYRDADRLDGFAVGAIWGVMSLWEETFAS